VVLRRLGDVTQSRVIISIVARGRVILLAILWSLGGVVIWGPLLVSRYCVLRRKEKNCCVERWRRGLLFFRC
jgi:hypothetical protein